MRIPQEEHAADEGGVPLVARLDRLKPPVARPQVLGEGHRRRRLPLGDGVRQSAKTDEDVAGIDARHLTVRAAQLETPPMHQMEGHDPRVAALWRSSASPCRSGMAMPHGGAYVPTSSRLPVMRIRPSASLRISSVIPTTVVSAQNTGLLRSDPLATTDYTAL